MKTPLRTTLSKTTLLALTACMALGAPAAFADKRQRDDDATQLLLGIAASFLGAQQVTHIAVNEQDRSRRDARYRQHSGYDRGHVNSARGFGNRNPSRHDFGASYTSEPIRGGSSRRTRIIENPYPGRPITGISFSGIDRDAVHINDVITYPRKRLISHRGYSLSLYHPSPFLGARGYVDYISVKAKRKEYFTVTFHYE